MIAIASAVRADPAAVAPLIATLAKALRVLSRSLEAMSEDLDSHAEDYPPEERRPTNYEVAGMQSLATILASECDRHSGRAKPILPARVFSEIERHSETDWRISHAGKCYLAADLVARCAGYLANLTARLDGHEKANALACGCDYAATSIMSFLNCLVTSTTECSVACTMLLNGTTLDSIQD